MEKLIRSLCKRLAFLVALLPAFVATGAYGASIEWQSMQGRERIVISKSMSDGMTGNIARIDAKGIAIPFAAMPTGLVMAEQPQNASIIQGTAQFGQTLAILTQTPKFGFVVSRQTPTQIVIDFFPDELGARWKPEEASAPAQASALPQSGDLSQTGDLSPSGAAPTLTLPVPPPTPPSLKPPVQTAQVANQATSSPVMPAGAEAGTAATPQSGHDRNTPQPATPPASSTAPKPIGVTGAAGVTGATGGITEQRPAPQDVGASATPIGWKEQPVPTNAPVLTADGTKPIPVGRSASPIPVVSLPAETPPTSPLPENILLDTRQDTAARSASLPAPGLDASLAGQPVTQNSPVPQKTSGTTGSPNAQIGSALPAPSVVTTAQNVPVTQNVPMPQVPDVLELPSGSLAGDANTTPSSSGTSVAGQQSGDEDLMRGVGVRVGPSSYRGIFNPHGVEGIATSGTGQVSGQVSGQASGQASGQDIGQGIIQGQPVSPPPAPNDGQQSGTAQPEALQPERPQAGGASIAEVPSPPENQSGQRQTGTPPASPQSSEHQLSGRQSSVRLVVDDSSATEQGGTKEEPKSQVSPDQATGQATDQATSQAPGQVSSQAEQAEQVEQAAATDALHAPASLEHDENVIYVNEDGEEIIPPADPALRLEEIRALVAEKKYEEANALVAALLEQTNLTKIQRENALHIRAEILFFLHRDNLQQHGGSIIEATDLAINANTRSPKNAVALLRLGYINLQLENIPEAEARFNMLRRMFPNDENVPLSYYYWGDYFYNHDDLERAIDQFQVVTQKYPGSKYAREASLGLARSFYRLGYYEQAFNIVEYIEQRWPRFYLNYPPFLNMMGDVAFRLNNYDFATRYYWLYVNLAPDGEEVDVILTRIGDIYSLQQQSVAAREVYGEVVERFPDTDGGLIALMRLAEESINDDPSIATMFNAFDNRPVLRPVDVYKKIITEYPQSKYVSLAQLKLAMWHLWNHDYTTTLDIADAFLRAKPQDELASKMKEVALKTFAVLSAESVANGSYSRMREIWEEYPMLQEQEEILTPESRVALGVSYWKDGRPDDALIAVEPFFLGNKIPEYSEMALSLVLQIYLQHDQWPAIEEVARRVSLWEISVENQMQLDYALALAREKMGKPDEAAVLWEKLYDSKRLPDDQMAFATYFLARDAEKRQRNDEAYLLGVEALKRLRGEAEKNPEQEDTAKIKTQISSLMSLTEEGGRLGESLEFADEYMQYLPEGDPDRAGVLFRMARINKKQGNEALWRERMTEVSRLYPDTVYGQTASAALKSTDLEKAASAYSPQR